MTTSENHRQLPPVGRAAFGHQGFGSMRLRGGPVADADRDPVAVLHAALDSGLTMVDTADAYQNEELVGRALRGRRDEVLLASKFGLVWDLEAGGQFDVRADPPYVRAACEASLRRLGVETIDLYYLHHRSEHTPIEETVSAMAGLVEEGKVRALGLSNVTDEDLRRAHAVHPITALQEEWSLVRRDVERLLPAVSELGTVVVAHSPTAHGVLHGERADGGPAEVLQEIAARRSVTPGQVALAWVHHRQRAHGVPVVPIPGTTSVGHLRENIAAAELELTEPELRRLEAPGGVDPG